MSAPSAPAPDDDLMGLFSAILDGTQARARIRPADYTGAIWVHAVGNQLRMLIGASAPKGWEDMGFPLPTALLNMTATERYALGLVVQEALERFLCRVLGLPAPEFPAPAGDDAP